MLAYRDIIFNELGILIPMRDPVLIFALAAVLILLAPVLARRAGLPGLVGIILAGAIFGDPGLGLLTRPGAIELLGTVGLLYLMFTAGLSLDLNQFQRNKSRSIIFGSVSFLIPQLIGVMAGIHLLGFSFQSAVLFGSIVGSHTLLALPLAAKMGIEKNKAITAATGGTIITDAASLSVLAVVAGLATGSAGSMFWIAFPTKVGAYLLFAILGLPWIGRWFFRNVHRESDKEYIFLLVILFASAVLAELAGLAPVIGAFLAGLVMNRLVPDTGALMNRVRFVGEALFIPFFLLSVGMLINFEAMIEGFQIWWFALVFTVIVVLGKGVAAKAVQLFFKDTADEGWTVAGLTIPQAAATLAVTLVGFELGLFDEVVVNAAILMMLFTCIIGPWAVQKWGRAVAMADEERSLEDTGMPQRILVPLGNPKTADRLLDIALAIRKPKSDDPLYALMVAPDDGRADEHVAVAEQLLAHAVIHAAGSGVDLTPITRIDMNIAGGVARAITEQRASHVVIGWHGEQTARHKILGSMLDQLLKETNETLMVCRLSENPATSGRILLILPPYSSHQPGVLEALRSVKLLSSNLGATLHLVGVQESVIDVETIMLKIKPDVVMKQTVLPNWSALNNTLKEIVHPDDTIVILAARKGRLAWRPGRDKLPKRISQRWENNLLVLYPTDVIRESSQPKDTPETRRALKSALKDGRVCFALKEAGTQETIRRILMTEFGEKPGLLDSLTSELTKNAESYSSELRPGIAVVHAHTRKIDANTSGPLLFIGISEEGITFSQSPQPIHLVVLLVTPGSASPSEHLNAVANIVRSIGTEEAVKAAKEANDIDELRDALV